MEQAARRPQSTFRFTIEGDLADFAAFCTIIRGEDPTNLDVLEKAVARLTTSTTKQAAAQAAAPHPRP